MRRRSKQAQSKNSKGSISRSTGQIKRKATLAVEAQKTINTDYKALVRDYGILFRKLWQIPPTKYVLGGFALAALIPFSRRIMQNYPEISERIRENLDNVEDKFEEVTDEISSKVASFKGGSKGGDVSEASH